jgi:ribosomal protein S27AE
MYNREDLEKNCRLKTCGECGCTQFVDVEIPDERIFDGVVHEDSIPAQECTRCGEDYTLGLHMQDATDRLVAKLEKLEDIGPDATRFMEKIKKYRMYLAEELQEESERKVGKK